MAGEQHHPDFLIADKARSPQGEHEIFVHIKIVILQSIRIAPIPIHMTCRFINIFLSFLCISDLAQNQRSYT